MATPNDPSAVPADLLALEYRERQFVSVLPPGSPRPLLAEPQASDYPWGLSGIKRGVSNVGSLFSWSYLTDPKNWGLFGLYYDRARRHRPGRLLKIPPEMATGLTFPPPHPLGNTVYAAHPFRPGHYVPLASFHHVLFEEKFVELFTILAGLGATALTMKCHRGYDRSGSAHAGIAGPPGGGAVAIGGRVTRTSEGTLEATFSRPGTPQAPTNGVWFPHEPTWRQLVESHLARRLTTLSIGFRYADDFGVNGKAAGMWAGLGLELGGEFQEHQTTEWTFRATFG